MENEVGRGVLDDLAAETRLAERLRALGEYAELRNRWLLRDDRPGDHLRRRALQRLLERSGGIPDELRWPRQRLG